MFKSKIISVISTRYRCLFMFLLTLSFLYYPLIASAAVYTVPPPTNLQASIWGVGGNQVDSLTGINVAAPAVTVEWQNSSAGLSYLITKINPDGSKMRFTLASSMTDPNCMMKGGFFQDPAVEKGKTYIYKVQAFDGSLNYSAEASITVTINIGDSIGCRGWQPVALRAESKNLSTRVSFNNPEKKTFDIYVNGKLKKTTTKESETIWPIIGRSHQIKIVEHKIDPETTFGLIERASACIKEPVEETVTVNTIYTGLFAEGSKLIFAIIDQIN